MMDREAWCVAVHGAAKSWTRLSDWTELRLPVYRELWFLTAVLWESQKDFFSLSVFLFPPTSGVYMVQMIMSIWGEGGDSLAVALVSFGPSLLALCQLQRGHRKPGLLEGDWGAYHVMTAAELVLQLSQGCSLHLAQRLSQLLSLQLRRMPILSKESAPGLIIATGELTLPVVTDGFSCWLTCSCIHRDPRHLG